MKTHIRRQQHKNFKHQDIKQKEPPQNGESKKLKSTYSRSTIVRVCGQELALTYQMLIMV